ncbi:glycosyltransferase family 2 protein [Caenimonas terrae]|uniref:Glycosyltransferase family 2 protein n=1 Tax=Caenimonas terrae TaxID=696074 RepID=A0ABW0NEK9_9BURK
MTNAPIALFIFKRPEHTRRTLESLAQNSEFHHSPLFIYCDGARNVSEVEAVETTRKLVRGWPHPDKTLIERDHNWGLAKSIIEGVTVQCDLHGKVIVVEDDLVVSPHYLSYMNAALVKYQDDDRVISVHGYSYPIDNLPEAFFIKGASCWGWATWKRGWDLFEPDGQKLYDELKRLNLMHRFNILGAFPYMRMLHDQILGRNNSWAIRWYASAFIKGKLTLHPGKSLVSNIGLDGTGDHCDPEDMRPPNFSSDPIKLEDIVVAEEANALQAWAVHLTVMRRKKMIKILSSLNLLMRVVRRRLGLL